MARGRQDNLSLWRAANWSVIIAALLLIPYNALRIYFFLHAAPAYGITSSVDGPLETAEQRLELALRVVIATPILLALAALALFIVLAVIFLLGRVARRYLLSSLPPPGGGSA